MSNSYWDAVLQEVLHKNCPQFNFMYTTLGDHFRDEELERERYLRYKKTDSRYYLGEPYPDVYLTQREFDCASKMVRGKTISETAMDLDISPRTVEYYLKNMRSKLKSHTRSELLCAILQTELMQQQLFIVDEDDDEIRH